MEGNMHRRKLILMLVLLLVISSACERDEKETFQLESADTTEEKVEQKKEQKTIFVYVCGAVNREGVYELPVGSRVYEAIEKAGGFLDTAAVTSVNQAELLEDEEKLYIPTQEEATLIQTVEDGKVNLNTATKDELQTIPGVGESKASLIIKYREEHGKFQTIEDVMNISGIKEGMFEKMKEYIKV